MLVLKVYCLPALHEDALREIHQSLVKVFIKYPAFGIKTEDDFLTLFPVDMMTYGLGTEVYLELSGVEMDADMVNGQVIDSLAEDLCKAIHFSPHLDHPRTVARLYPSSLAVGFHEIK